MLFAAGAGTLYPSVAGFAPLRTHEDLSRIPDRLPDAGTNIIAVHLFSSCPMGARVGTLTLRDPFLWQGALSLKAYTSLTPVSSARRLAFNPPASVVGILPVGMSCIFSARRIGPMAELHPDACC